MTSRRGFVAFLLGLPLGGCGRSSETPVVADPPSAAKPPKPPAEPAPPARPGDLDAHVESLRARFDARGWTVVAEPPFAVVGDGGGPRVSGHASGTIRWAVTHLEAAYFEAPPEHIITIYLFETAESYERHARELFGEPPDTPYGYYSPSDRALVMNIATGGGTLVHEIVHPYMAGNFPSCPSWFDEGLASLYEQSSERPGEDVEIVGLTNWRLAGLQEALRAKTVPSFQQLCESGRGFYTDDPGSNYAQARYLCYWLQEQRLLQRFYREFRANVNRDPSGYATLTGIVAPDLDMDGFRTRWEQFVLALRFPD
jgi:hypothetical protein